MHSTIRSRDPSELSKYFIGADPFDHIVIDDFLVEESAEELAANFPNEIDKTWWLYDNPLEKKLAYNDLSNLPDCYSKFFDTVNSDAFTSWLSHLTGVTNLRSDSSLRGGGLHYIRPGGKLDIHQDFNVHKELNMLRKVNLIVYLNKDWRDDWQGHLELWDKDMKVMKQKILPCFNRAVIFRTDMESNHGHPRPLTCPQDRGRMSLASYYYTSCDNIDSIPYKSTVYKKLPGDDDGLDELRESRSRGRLTNSTSGGSNV
jgi:Rps23 Pro-64 3,4-dihydroxylase Tpa1-like proline 4-hydroxylase